MQEIPPYRDLTSGTEKTYNVPSKNDPASRGRPFTWNKLDSINIDFVQDVSFSDGSPYLSEDWDLSLSDPYASAAKASEYNIYPRPPEMTVGDRKYLRVHHSIRFEAPYKVRPQAERDGEQDVLWGRIESEPMIFVPDALNGKGNVTAVKAFNSVRQIIINFNQSNCGSNDRPVILFYEGPERYDTNNSLRDSKPIIVNFNHRSEPFSTRPKAPLSSSETIKTTLKGLSSRKNICVSKPRAILSMSVGNITKNIPKTCTNTDTVPLTSVLSSNTKKDFISQPIKMEQQAQNSISLSTRTQREMTRERLFFADRKFSCFSSSSVI